MADHRHKRDTNARLMPARARAVVIAGPLAVLATASAVTFGVLAAEPAASDMFRADLSAAATADVGAALADRGATVSRGAARRAPVAAEPVAAEGPRVVAGALIERKPTEIELALAPAATKQAVRSADEKLWTQATLNLWSAPGEAAEEIGEIDVAEEVLVTGRSFLGREEIVVDGQSRWVTAGYLDPEEPMAIGGECTNGTSVPSGVSPNIAKVHEAVCADFPEITVYGTFRSDGEHSQGIAVDIMTSGERGWQVANFVRENYAALGVNYVIYSQNIWSVDRSGEGWRGMSDRGSTTANHYDHVHVTTY